MARGGGVFVFEVLAGAIEGVIDRLVNAAAAAFQDAEAVPVWVNVPPYSHDGPAVCWN